MRRAVAFGLALLRPALGTDPNLVTDDSNPENYKKDFDSHGCDQAQGTYWCAIKGRCVTTWETCEPLLGYNEKCTADWSGLSWDLSALKGKVYTITDAVATNPSYAYAFSICGNVDLAETGFTDNLKAACASTTGTSGEVFSDPAPAFQVINGNTCKRAGADQSGSLKGSYETLTAWNKHADSALSGHVLPLSGGVACTSTEKFVRGNQMEWALLDPLNPAMGLELTYTGGNTCKENQFQASSKCDYSGADGRTYCSRGMKIRMVR